MSTDKKCRDCDQPAIEVKLTMPRDPGTFMPNAPTEVVGVIDHLCAMHYARVYGPPQTKEAR